MLNLGGGRLDWMKREGRLGEGGKVDSGKGRLDWVRGDEDWGREESWIGKGRLDWKRRDENNGDGEKATVDWRREGHWTAEEAGRQGEGEKTGWTGRGREGWIGEGVKAGLGEEEKARLGLEERNWG